MKILTRYNTLHDDMKSDLAKLQSLFTGSVQTVYPRVSGELQTKLDALAAKKSTASTDAQNAATLATNQGTIVASKKATWDATEEACEDILKDTYSGA